MLEQAKSQINSNKYNDAEKTARLILKKQPANYPAHNILGLALQGQQRYEDAIAVFKQATKFSAKDIAGWLNLGNTYFLQKKFDDAEKYFEIVLSLDKKNIHALRHLSFISAQLQAFDKAINYLDKAINLNSTDISLYRAKAHSLRNINKSAEAVDTLEQMLQLNPENINNIIELAEANYKWTGNIDRARNLYKLAYSKGTNDPLLIQKMCTFFHECCYGIEAENLAVSYELAKQLYAIAPDINGASGTIQSVAISMLDYELYEKYGKSIDKWTGQQQLGRVTTTQDRLDLIAAHRKAGKMYRDVANANPIVHKVKQRFDNKIRLGVLSSDLRQHAVGYFAWPMIKYIDKSKFDIYCYSAYPHSPDKLQEAFTSNVTSFKSYPNHTNHAIAQAIADDNLDVLVELGGLTLFSRVDVCAYKPAPVQISWVGYAHPFGLDGAIDYIVMDQYTKPENPQLLIEKPFLLKDSWVALDSEVFIDTPLPATIAQDRKGYVTFGSANAIYKLTPETIAVWANIMHMVPNSRFIYMRPESVAAPLRQNFINHMSANGITSERISFIAERNNYRPYYGEIDISLDTFPHTGGTMTCESLWMGVPVITLVGQSFFERVSYSNNCNAGLADLCAFDIEQYKIIAVKLAQDIDRRRFLLNNLRLQIKQNPLGKPIDFAYDFGCLLEQVVKG